eukprot:CAMPEP_0177404172 /NCGR_PEP_ID=MMETSP0368-20130122/61265_1 /TAXON_ID=447022 ORGANISM="Scrippsiella hangoei-like, Strain SHHI-4" /NCGR_SAMPLE_ID=MMETSP0368 /ASSEMBLY_ACC=CAM_ASM_000363 /LENGTH=45 /DNA_ID= /DNA_START= /DNA_END= /DNA_ORIENTATION=
MKSCGRSLLAASAPSLYVCKTPSTTRTTMMALSLTSTTKPSWPVL